MTTNSNMPPVNPFRILLAVLILLAAVALASYGLGLIVHNQN